MPARLDFSHRTYLPFIYSRKDPYFNFTSILIVISSNWHVITDIYFLNRVMRFVLITATSKLYFKSLTMLSRGDYLLHLVIYYWGDYLQ